MCMHVCQYAQVDLGYTDIENDFIDVAAFSGMLAVLLAVFVQEKT